MREQAGRSPIFSSSRLRENRGQSRLSAYSSDNSQIPSKCDARLLLLSVAVEYHPTIVVSMQLKIESHFCSLVLKISLYSRSPTTRTPPFLNCHALFVHGSESTELRLHIVFILDEAGEANSLLKFWAVIPVCFFEFLMDEGISITGESLGAGPPFPCGIINHGCPTLRGFVRSHDILYKVSLDILYTPGA